MLVTPKFHSLLPGHPFPTAITGFPGDSRCHAGITRYVHAWGLLGHAVPCLDPSLDIFPKVTKPQHAL